MTSMDTRNHRTQIKTNRIAEHPARRIVMRPVRLFVSILIAAAALLAVSVPASAATCTINGVQYTATKTGSCVIIGTCGNEVIIGSDLADTIDGKGRNDVICGLGGVDVIAGGAGDDITSGGSNVGFLRGGPGN